MSLEIDCIKLIESVKKRVPLYDISSREHNDRLLKKKLWIEVCEEVFSPPVWNSLTPGVQGHYELEVQKKWTNLRNCFRRELRLQHTPPTGVHKWRRKYIFFDELSFLLPFVKVDFDPPVKSEENSRLGDLEIDASTLIAEVKKRAPLYDSTITEYTDQNWKKTLWTEICQVVFTPQVWKSLSENKKTLYMNTVRKKWINLRHCFRRDVATQIRQSTNNIKKRKVKYVHYDELSFLMPFTVFGKQSENQNVSGEYDTGGSGSAEASQNDEEDESESTSTESSDDNEDDPGEECVLNVTPPTTGTKNQLDNPGGGSEYNSAAMLENIKGEFINIFPDVYLHDHNQPQSQEFDKEQNCDELFLLSLLPYMKDIPADKKLEFRMEMLKMFMNFKKSLQKNGSDECPVPSPGSKRKLSSDSTPTDPCRTLNQ